VKFLTVFYWHFIIRKKLEKSIVKIQFCCHFLFFSVLLSPAVSIAQKPTVRFGFPTFGSAIKEGDQLEFMMIRVLIRLMILYWTQQTLSSLEIKKL